MRISDWSSDVCSSDLAVLDELRGNFDIIILDGPPVLGLADAPLIASIVGNAVFVVEASRGHRGATKTALRRLRTGHAHILGAVLTKFDPKKSASTYNYYGYDYYQYGADVQDRKSTRLNSSH